MNPLLSIIIPTKNRHEYLQVVLDILHKLEDNNLEIIIQDNSDDDGNRQAFLLFINELQDNRLKYFYCKDKLSINENSDKAVLNSKGKYVCFIGDDDCVTSYIVDVARWMDLESIEVCTFRCASYIWGDVEYKHLSKRHTGILSYVTPTGKFEQINSSEALDNHLKKGGQTIDEMPKLYHGIASRAILDQIFKQTGSYFPGSVPDMDVALCLSIYSTSFRRINAPIIISGIARKSAAGLGAAKMHKGSIDKISTLPRNTGQTWNPYVPFYWSGPTIYADSVHKCLKLTGNDLRLKRFNYNYLYAMLIVFHSEYYKETFRVIKTNSKSSILKIAIYSFLIFSIRLTFFVKNRLPFIYRFRHHKISLPTISEAVTHMEAILSNIELPWHNKPGE